MGLYKSIFFTLFPMLLLGQSYPNPEIDSLLKAGIENIILHNYRASNKIFTDLDKHFKDIPFGKIYLAATEISKSVDYEEELNSEYVDSLINLAQIQTDSLLETDDTNIWYNYFDALILGHSAYYHSLSGNIITAFSDGVLCLRSFQRSLEVKADFPEAFIAIGTYNYWKSAQVKSLLWLPFFPDNREEGIQYLEKALVSASYNKHLAAYSLIWIYIDYGESNKAVDLALKMLEEYPTSRYFMWGLARAYQEIDKRKAISIYSEILASVKQIESNNQYNEIVLMHKIAMLYEELDQLKPSLKLCNEILDFKINSGKIKEKLKGRFDRTKDLRESILERMD